MELIDQYFEAGYTVCGDYDGTGDATEDGIQPKLVQ